MNPEDELRPDAWIFDLSLEHLRKQASLRALNEEDTVSVLRARLLRYEKSRRGELTSFPASPALSVGPSMDKLAQGELGPGDGDRESAVENLLSGTASPAELPRVNISSSGMSDVPSRVEMPPISVPSYGPS